MRVFRLSAKKVAGVGLLTLLLALLLALSAVPAWAAIVADEYEPDDTAATASSIATDGTEQLHTIHDMNDVDYVAFEVSAGTAYLVETDYGDGMDTEMTLYESDGSTQIDYADSGGNFMYAALSFTATADETLYVAVTGVSESVGAYVLRISELGPLGHITGTVTSDGVAGLEDIGVQAYHLVEDEYGSWWEWRATVFTDADGCYDIGDLVTGTYRVCFFDPSGTYLGECYDDAPDLYSATDIDVVGGETTGGIDAVLDVGGRISGTVTSDGSTGIEGVFVEVYRYDEQHGGDGYWTSVCDQMTDSDGHYDIGALSAGTYRVGFRDWRNVYLPEYYDDAERLEVATDIVVFAGETTGGIDAVLTEGGHITGTVTSDGTTGISGVGVFAYLLAGTPDGEAWDVVSYAFTDADGYYDIAGLPSGTYRVGFVDYEQNYINEYYDDALALESATDITVVGGEVTENIDAILSDGGHIAGTVTSDGSSGIAFVDVVAYRLVNDPEGDWWEVYSFASTDSDGHYDFAALGEGTYRVRFTDWSGAYLEEYYDDAPNLDSATDVFVSGGETVEGIDAILSAAGHITGTVTSDGTTGIQDIIVQAYRLVGDGAGGDWVPVCDVGTDAEGHYDVAGLTSGTYRLKFYDWTGVYPEEYYDDAASLRAATDITVVVGETISGIDAALSALWSRQKQPDRF